MTDYYTAYLPGVEKRGKYKNKLKFIFIFILSVVATYYWLDREKPMSKTVPVDLLVSDKHTSSVPLAINDKESNLKVDKLEINNLESKSLATNKPKKEESKPVVTAQVIVEKPQLIKVEKKRVVKSSQIEEIDTQLIESTEKNNIENTDLAIITPFIEKAVKLKSQVPIVEDVDIVELQKSYEEELGRLIINN